MAGDGLPKAYYAPIALLPAILNWRLHLSYVQAARKNWPVRFVRIQAAWGKTPENKLCAHTLFSDFVPSRLSSYWKRRQNDALLA
jgi:hypothetical protein